MRAVCWAAAVKSTCQSTLSFDGTGVCKAIRFIVKKMSVCMASCIQRGVSVENMA